MKIKSVLSSVFWTLIIFTVRTTKSFFEQREGGKFCFDRKGEFCLYEENVFERVMNCPFYYFVLFFEVHL